jgi:hypothetical protein
MKKDNTLIYIAIGAGILYWYYMKKKNNQTAGGGSGTSGGSSSPAAAAARTVQAVDNSTFKEYNNSFKAQYQKDISKCVM